MTVGSQTAYALELIVLEYILYLDHFFPVDIPPNFYWFIAPKILLPMSNIKENLVVWDGGTKVVKIFTKYIKIFSESV